MANASVRNIGGTLHFYIDDKAIYHVPAAKADEDYMLRLKEGDHVIPSSIGKGTRNKRRRRGR